MNKLKKYALVLSALMVLLAVIGCSKDYTAQILCDSGFKSPVSEHAFIEGGNVYWIDPKIKFVHSVRSDYHSRKMTHGETCMIKKIYS